ncbi:MAG: precorrin-6A reductase [Spirochaetaceae bacterium]|jgi:precorrin-6x reductase|nr:precorrin-6A reductase [Spirochaetaceae bacterium]
MAAREILVFAGTSEGRRLVREALADAPRPVSRHFHFHVFVATRYGRELLESFFNGKEGKDGKDERDHGQDGLRGAVTVYGERLDAAGIYEKIRTIKPCFVIDCTHPYAAEATKNIKSACKSAGAAYLRLRRDTESRLEGAVYVDTMEEAARFLSLQDGTLFLAIGSNRAACFAPLRDRVFLRVLPLEESIRRCLSEGFSPKRIIALHGPVSEALNRALLRETGAAWLVTKETGVEGGFMEKVRAARAEGVKILVVRPPAQEAGYGAEEIRGMIRRGL